MSDVNSVLLSQENALVQDTEIERILSCSAKDHYAILQINPLAVSKDSLASALRKSFRKKSLLIHPDKSSNSEAPKAFDRLKKSHAVLASEEGDDNPGLFTEKTNLKDVYNQVAEALEAETELPFEHKANIQIRTKVAEILSQHEKSLDVEKQYLQRQEAQKQDEIKTAAKDRAARKSWEERWEQDRDLRVLLWRTYSAKVEKPKKKKTKKVLA